MERMNKNFAEKIIIIYDLRKYGEVASYGLI